MSILDDFPSTTVSVQTYAGSAGDGELFATPVDRSVFIEDKRRQVRAADGQLMLSETTLYDQLDAAALYVAGSRVIVGNFTGTVIRAATNHIGDPEIDHVAVQLDHLGALT